jgi:hypothetical protein
MLAAATGRPILPSTSATGTAIGAALLYDPRPLALADMPHVAPDDPRRAAYAKAWRGAVEG